MSIYKTLTIDDKQVTFAASAAVPRLYRCRFNRDLFHDFKTLGTASDGKSYDVESLEVFENVAYIMAKAADGGKDTIPDTLRSGWRASACSRFTRYCRSFLTCGTSAREDFKTQKAGSRRRPRDDDGAFPLRCLQLGLSMQDLDSLTVGFVNDMFVELHEDDEEHDLLAQQKTSTRFKEASWLQTG